MMRRIGYLIMKLSMRQQSDPISRALDGSLSTDPSVVAFVDELRVAAGREESMTASPPMDAIVDAVTSGSNPAYGDLSPVRHVTARRRLVRAFTTAGLATKLLFGAAAVAAVTTTAAVTGTLPGPVQDFVADSVDGVGIDLPHADDGDGLPEPASTVPGERIEHRDDVQDHNDCVQEARAAYIAANGNAAGFDGVAACGERPDPQDYDGPNAPGLEDNPSDTRPVRPTTPADTRPEPPGRPGG